MVVFPFAYHLGGFDHGICGLVPFCPPLGGGDFCKTMRPGALHIRGDPFALRPQLCGAHHQGPLHAHGVAASDVGLQADPG